MNDLESFFTESQSSVEAFNAWAEKSKPAAKADHICFKCADAAEFERLRMMLEMQSTFVYQSIISKRRISVIKFLQPIQTALGEIWFLELADQKPDSSQVSGFDHIEIYPTSGTYEELAQQLSTTVTFDKVVRPHHTTYDAKIFGEFKVRLEEEPLVDKIKREEMR